MAINSEGTRSAVDRQLLRKVQWAILPVVFLMYTFNYLDRASISYAQLTMSEDLGIDIATYGNVAAVFFVAYVLLEVPSNIIMSKVGARVWLSRIAITWGLVAALTGFVQNATQLYIARVLLGVAEAGLFPGLVLFLTYWFLTHDRARALSMMVLAQPIALILGSISGGLILDYVDWFGLSSWRWVFILQGLPPILLGVWLLFYLADRPSKARWLSHEEADRLENAIAAEYQGDRDEHMGAHKKVNLRALKEPKVLYLAFILLLGGIGTYGLAYFLPLVIKQMNPDYAPTNIGLVGAIPYLCGAAALPLVARFSDLRGNRKGITMACLSTSVVGLVLTVVFRETPAIGLVGLCLFAIGIIAYIPPFWAMASESLTRAQSAVGLALINSFASAGGFFGPFLIGKVAQGAANVTIGLVVPLVALSLAVVLLIFVRPEKGSPAEVTHTV
jgi:MFS transporter, ACS family, tartrate transporter